MFKPVFRQLTDVAQIVYLDLRGSGRSDDAPDGIYSLERWADDLDAFCRQLGIDKPIVLGNSAGGMVAAMYGIRHPDGPGKLVLSSTQGRLDPQRCLDVFHRLGGDQVRDVAKKALVDVGDMAAFADYARVCMPLLQPDAPSGAPPHDLP